MIAWVFTSGVLLPTIKCFSCLTIHKTAIPGLFRSFHHWCNYRKREKWFFNPTVMTSRTPPSWQYRVHWTNSSSIENSVKSTKFGAPWQATEVPEASQTKNNVLFGPSDFIWFSIFSRLTNEFFNYPPKTNSPPKKWMLPSPPSGHFSNDIPHLPGALLTNFQSHFCLLCPQMGAPESTEMILGHTDTIPPFPGPNRPLFSKQSLGGTFSAPRPGGEFSLNWDTASFKRLISWKLRSRRKPRDVLMKFVGTCSSRKQPRGRNMNA